MKKIISILTVFAMLLAFAAIPAMAADLTIDFASEDNLAYGKSVKHLKGTYYGSTGNPSTAGKQGKLTDGDVSTYYYSYAPSSKGTVAFQLDLGEVYNLNKVALYTKNSRTVNVYVSSSTDYANGTLIGNAVKGIDGTVNGNTSAELVINLDTAVPGQYITIEQTTGSSASYWQEFYVEGTSVSGVSDADKVAADNAALTLGDTSALTAKLTLPTAGNVYGSTITWATSDASVIATNGTIYRVGEDRTATLTATITSGEVSDTKTFDVTVKAYDTYTLDLSAENNILLGKTITPIAGRYYSSTGAPSADVQNATDGDLTTAHSGNGKVNSVVTGLVFSVDLEEEHLVDTLTLLADEAHFDRTIKIYNGAAVDGTKLLGTYTCAAGGANYVVAGDQGKALSVYSCDLPEATVASQLTIAYESGYDFAYFEIAATGRAIQEGEIIRDFTSSDNLAYKKDNAMVIGHYYDKWTPAEWDRATDGDIASTHRATGAYSGEGTGSYYGFAYKIDLGAYYKLSEITLYTTENPGMKISFCSENEHKVTSVGNSSNRGGYILNSQGGIVNGGFASVPKESGVPVTVNGTPVYANTVNPGADAEPVRHLIVFVQGGTLTYNELYVAGTPFAGELSFAEADFGCITDEELGTKVVNAKVALMNKTDAATSGTIYFAAYNEEGALVGFTTAAVNELIAGATYDTPVTFQVSDVATAVKAFYWSNDGAYVPIINAINAN